MPRAAMVAVVVLYGREADESEAFTSLQTAASELPLHDALHLLVYDNSPAPHTLAPVALHVEYIHDAANGGLAPAYNAALRKAEASGCEWLLLLDQDTDFKPDFLAELLNFMDGEPAAEVVAAVPRLVERSVVLSPRRWPRWSHGKLPEEARGLTSERVSAFNSGALLRVSALRSAGGFPLAYTLDFLDHVIFHELQSRGGRVWLLGSTLAHQLSTASLRQSMPAERYARMLRSERRFYRERGSLADRAWYRLRRMKRLAGLVVRRADAHLIRLELRALLGLER